MKKYILALLLSLLPSLGFAAVTHVQSTGISSSGSVASVSKVFTGSVTSGNTILVGVICHAGGCTDAPTDDQSNTYTMSVNSLTGSSGVAIANNVVAGTTTVTVTPPSSDFVGFGISEFSGIADSSPGDGTAVGIGGAGSNATTSSNITTSAAGVLYAVLQHDGADTLTEDGSWSLVYEDESWTSIAGSVIYRIAASGTYAPSWTKGDGVTYEASAAAYKEQSGAAAHTARRVMVIE